ncbi:hypothetical protein G6F35_008571 [Rhizopus arrhizus]|nr:hypothetical protein G6F35_008571 [Rhizopus arrhizus]
MFPHMLEDNKLHFEELRHSREVFYLDYSRKGGNDHPIIINLEYRTHNSKAQPNVRKSLGDVIENVY